MGDNSRRARAWPRREGRCGTCGRWLVVGQRTVLPRHGNAYAGDARCPGSGTEPIATYPAHADTESAKTTR